MQKWTEAALCIDPLQMKECPARPPALPPRHPGAPPRGRLTPTRWSTSPPSNRSCSRSSQRPPLPLRPPLRRSRRPRRCPAAPACRLVTLCQCPVATPCPRTCPWSRQPTPPQSSSDTSLWMRMVRVFFWNPTICFLPFIFVIPSLKYFMDLSIILQYKEDSFPLPLTALLLSISCLGCISTRKRPLYLAPPWLWWFSCFLQAVTEAHSRCVTWLAWGGGSHVIIQTPQSLCGENPPFLVPNWTTLATAMSLGVALKKESKWMNPFTTTDTFKSIRGWNYPKVGLSLASSLNVHVFSSFLSCLLFDIWVVIELNVMQGSGADP